VIRCVSKYIEYPHHDWIERKLSQKKENYDDDGDDDIIANLKIQEANNVQDTLRSAQAEEFP
jgi:hypothetical protein